MKPGLLSLWISIDFYRLQIVSPAPHSRVHSVVLSGFSPVVPSIVSPLITAFVPPLVLYLPWLNSSLDRAYPPSLGYSQTA